MESAPKARVDGRRPDAIFAANDLSAIETMRVAAARGLRVPDDLSVVGFDDIPDAASHSPALTTIRQPLPQMGAVAVHMLLDMFDGGSTRSVRMPASLVVRESTAPPVA